RRARRSTILTSAATRARASCAPPRLSRGGSCYSPARSSSLRSPLRQGQKSPTVCIMDVQAPHVPDRSRDRPEDEARLLEFISQVEDRSAIVQCQHRSAYFLRFALHHKPKMLFVGLEGYFSGPVLELKHGCAVHSA